MISHIQVDANSSDGNKEEHDVSYVGDGSVHMICPLQLSLLKYIPHHKNIPIPHVFHLWSDAISHNHVVLAHIHVPSYPYGFPLMFAGGDPIALKVSCCLRYSLI